MKFLFAAMLITAISACQSEQKHTSTSVLAETNKEIVKRVFSEMAVGKNMISSTRFTQ